MPKTIHTVSCTFGEYLGNKVVEKGTLCKMARGEMVRWLAAHNVTKLEEIKAFDRLEFAFCEALSDRNNLIFLKGKGAF